MVKSTGFLAKGPGFDLQYPQSSSQASMLVDPWGPTPSSGHRGYCMQKKKKSAALKHQFLYPKPDACSYWHLASSVFDQLASVDL